MAEELNDQEHRETELWQVLDWSLWGNGLGDVLRESIADKTFAAITVEERETAERCIKAWHERRGPSMAVGEGTELAKRVAYLEARVGELHNTIGEQRSELERWRSGQRHKAMPVVKEAPDGITYAARLLRAQGTEGGDEHDELLRNAGARLATLTDVARRLLVDRDRVEASRQAWAEEAMRLEFRLEQVREDRQRRIEKGNRLRSALVDAFGFDQDPDEYPGDEEFIRLLAAGAVHPETRGEGEERSGRDSSGQASREEAAEETVGTGYPKGSGPGCGSATPAPPSSCLPSVHPDGDVA